MSRTPNPLLCAIGVALVACCDYDSYTGTAADSPRTDAEAGVVCGSDAEPPAPKPDGGARRPKKELVTAPQAGFPEYALLGRVVRGLDVVRAIGELGDPASGEAGTPLRTVVIEGTRVRES